MGEQQGSGKQGRGMVSWHADRFPPRLFREEEKLLSSWNAFPGSDKKKGRKKTSRRDEGGGGGGKI